MLFETVLVKTCDMLYNMKVKIKYNGNRNNNLGGYNIFWL